MSIRNKLVLVFVTLSLILVSGTGLTGYFIARDALITENFDQLQSIAAIQYHRLRTLIYQNYERLNSVSHLLQTSPILANFIQEKHKEDQDRLNRVLKTLPPLFPNSIDIVVADPGGKVIASTDETIIDRVLSADESLTIGHNGIRSNIYWSQWKQKALFYTSSPVYIYDELIAVIILYTDPNEIAQIVLDYAGLDTTGETLVARRSANGDALYITPLRFDPVAALVRTVAKERLETPIIQALLKNEASLTDRIDYRDKAVYAVTKYIAETDWGLVVKIDRAEAMAPVTDLGNLLIVISIIFLLAAALVSWYLSHALSLPIKSLTGTATRIASGDLTQRARITSKDETGLLAKAFNLMADNLVTANTNLEKKISERTSELETANCQLQQELGLRHQAEELIRTERDKLEAVTDSLGAGVALIDTSYRIIWMNTFMKSIFGGAVGEFCYSSLHKSVSICDGCGIDGVLKGKTDRAVYERLGTDQNGKTAWYQIVVTPLKDSDGNIIAALDMVIPVTERKLMEQRLQMSSKMASIGALASGVAHEINNPLTAVIGYAQLLMDNKDITEQIKEDLEKISGQGQRAARIVQNLLTFARKYKPEKSEVDINQLILDTLDLRSYELKTSNITVKTNFTSAFIEIIADRHQIQQVLLNLIVNAEYAIRKAKRQGCITIETSKRNGSIKILIADNGVGISPHNLAKIFDPFFTTKEVGEGSGLGLAVSYGIIAEHNGTIYAESQEGEGSTFTIELPVKAETAADSTGGVTVSEAHQPGSRTGKILIVEDETAIQDILTRILSARGHQVDAVSSGDEALNRIAETDYDLYLLDLKMPGMGGEDLYEILKQNKPDSAKRVIFITGDTVTGDTHRFLESTGRPFLDKPFKPSDIITAIDQALS